MLNDKQLREVAAGLQTVTLVDLGADFYSSAQFAIDLLFVSVGMLMTNARARDFAGEFVQLKRNSQPLLADQCYGRARFVFLVRPEES